MQGVIWGVLLGSTPVEERERNRMEQREKSNYDVRTKASVDSMGDSEARISLQSCPEWGQGEQVSMLPSGSIIVYRLPQKGSCQGNSQRRLTAKGHLPTVLPAAGGTSPSFFKGGWRVCVEYQSPQYCHISLRIVVLIFFDNTIVSCYICIP